MDINNYQSQHIGPTNDEEPTPTFMKANNVTAQDQTKLLCSLIETLIKMVEPLTCQPISQGPTINLKTGRPYKHYC